MHPPRPRLTVRVGVAGHRWDKLKRQHAGAVRERLGQVFDSIEDVVDQVLAALYRWIEGPMVGTA